MSLSEKKLLQINETLKDFKCLVPRYLEVKNDQNLLELFCSRNRNPLWDITNVSYFKTGLISESAKKAPENTTDDHFIQRKLSMRLVMESLVNNPNMSLEEFVEMIRKYSSTIIITKDEHTLVSQRTKNTGMYNFQVYSELGIVIEGIDDYTKGL